MKKTQKALFKIFSVSLCSLSVFMATFVPVFAANSGSAYGDKANGSGRLYGQVAMLRLSDGTSCTAETMTTSRVNKKTVALSVQYKNGDTFWKPAKKTVSEDSECVLYNNHLSATDKKLIAFSTHETIYTKSYVLYLRADMEAN